MTIPDYSCPKRNRQVLLVERPSGIPRPEHFRLVETPLAPLADGQILIRNVYLSVDPAQRGWAADLRNYSPPVALGSVMRALGVGVVLESRMGGIRPGDIVYGWTGWQDYGRLDLGDVLSSTRTPRAPISAYAGVLGINGMTAWLAFGALGRPRAGEAALVSTAAGAVGSVVGQLARAEGCRPLGLTGSDAKAEACVARFGFDAAFNYKRGDWRDRLGEAAPEGIDIFFDSVGGDILDDGLRRMRTAGRVVQCGTASIASWDPPPMGLRNEREVLARRLSWSGFVIFDHQSEFSRAIAGLESLIEDGRLVYDEDIEVGIEAAPGALQRLYAGENVGKKLIFIG
jgi:hypothetical protein